MTEAKPANARGRGRPKVRKLTVRQALIVRERINEYLEQRRAEHKARGPTGRKFDRIEELVGLLRWPTRGKKFLSPQAVENLVSSVLTGWHPKDKRGRPRTAEAAKLIEEQSKRTKSQARLIQEAWDAPPDPRGE